DAPFHDLPQRRCEFPRFLRTDEARKCLLEHFVLAEPQQLGHGVVGLQDLAFEVRNEHGVRGIRDYDAGIKRGLSVWSLPNRHFRHLATPPCTRSPLLTAGDPLPKAVSQTCLSRALPKKWMMSGSPAVAAVYEV